MSFLLFDILKKNQIQTFCLCMYTQVYMWLSISFFPSFLFVTFGLFCQFSPKLVFYSIIISSLYCSIIFKVSIMRQHGCYMQKKMLFTLQIDLLKKSNSNHQIFLLFSSLMEKLRGQQLAFMNITNMTIRLYLLKHRRIFPHFASLFNWSFRQCEHNLNNKNHTMKNRYSRTGRNNWQLHKKVNLKSHTYIVPGEAEHVTI